MPNPQEECAVLTYLKRVPQGPMNPFFYQTIHKAMRKNSSISDAKELQTQLS
ncbi:hypothetical protein Bhyg_16308 [Pseudolycoriella hygida]|uniref:Uncharacterized protein n=1 Tax=Pseudolycoriella hygida TaxID=35572 RepID=A0A9Q0MKD2_9DIPT|nr:hypothetical protein Bhyg_16308 [Pseudolycoriella hygida]